MFFYKKCTFIFKEILKKELENIYLKDDFGPCSEYIFNKLVNYYKDKHNVYIIFDENFTFNKINSLYVNFRFISTYNLFFDYDLSDFYYNKTNEYINKLINLKNS